MRLIKSNLPKISEIRQYFADQSLLHHNLSISGISGGTVRHTGIKHNPVTLVGTIVSICDHKQSHSGGYFSLILLNLSG